MTVRFDWRGPAVLRALDGASADALADAAEHVLEESNRTVPIEEGMLQDSGAIDVEGDEATVYYDTPYAVRLHENPQYHFQHGRRGKWLSLTLGETKDRVAEFLHSRVKRVFE